ncbi:MAG: MFS transporter [Gammaproteobacteria bacterium]|nr:MFS transporter [Gammaproteobacteria bacterium]
METNVGCKSDLQGFGGIRGVPLNDDQLYARVTWRLVPFLFACYVCAYLDRVNVGFAKLTMLDALGFSETVYGLGAGVFFIGYFLFEIPSNLALHRFGARRTIARIMVAWGLLSAATLWVTTPTQFYVLRFLLGAAEAGFFPGIILYLTYWYPAARRARVTALFATAVPLASVIGAPLSGWLLEHFDGVRGLAGWQWLFLLEALPSVLLGLCALALLDDRIADARWLSDAERARLTAALEAEQRSDAPAHALDGLRRPAVWRMAAVYFAFVMGLYGLNFWLPTLVRDLGFRGALDIGLVTALPFAAAAVAMVLVARHSDQHGERRWHTVIPALLGAVGLAASVPLAQHTGLALLALTVGACGVLCALVMSWSLTTALVQGAAAASGIALVNSFGNLSGFVGPYAIGYLKDTTGGTAPGVLMLAASMVVGAALVARQKTL